ncbi:sugar-binding domain-containing protein [Seonamhaeicola aphaedonensis]|uniref:beta-galactosidase n=1 Tax=Seonamhaeicola aphaedonensis TaxID=1461338 RepID=A0A3D9HEA2_9FLAO|nr:sugar-binding domain-containing protein [Seonamhaeicola aphaedonensis]RED47817.1 glycosyl hydrolase family 2 [Seonamhaeicola aphaedonensis]
MKYMFFTVLTAFLSIICYGQKVINLAGEWQVKLDTENKGIEEQWFNENTFTDVLTLPGCIQEQGYGNIPGPNTPWYGNTEWAGSGGLNGWGPDYLSKYKERGIYKMQHFLHPERHFIGAVWYQRSIEVPKAWEGKQIAVSFERVHWVSQLWFDGKEVGKATSLAAPHQYSLGQLTPGSHTITIRVDNSEYVHMGYNAHSVSEQTAGTWNGIVGDIKLEARPEVWIERFTVSPKPVDGMLKVSLQLGKTITAKGKWELTLDAIGISKGNEHNPEPLVLKGNVNEIDGKMLHFDYPMTDKALLWDEYEQNLYQIEAKLKTKKSNDSRQLTFGLRDISVDGMHFSVNGNKTFIRGNNDCAVMPATGYAPMDVESWRKVWRTYKDFGLNLARFHSWTPPKAAFIAADEIGIYMAPEVGEWGTVKTKEQFDFMRAEAKRILDEFGHHPSFVMMGLGNEYDGNHDFFTEVVQEWKAYDNSKLYMVKANSWSPAEADYQVQRGIWPERTTKLRYQFGWPPTPDRTEYNLSAPNTAIDWREASSSFKVPVMSHEIAQICTYPDVETELKKYTGYLKADYLEIARDQLIERGMYALLPEIVESSGKWQVELIREAFEAAYRTPDMAGFQWLSLADFTGQSSAPVGLTDPFYDARPYVDLEYIRQWCAPTVLLARIPKRVLTQSETFKADLEVTHFGKEELVLNDLTATLRKDDGTVIKTWELPKKTFIQESAQAIASIELALGSIAALAKINLQVESKANKLMNDWNIWVYPDAPAETFPANVHVAKAWNEETQKRLEAGETVLLLPQIGDMKGNLPSCFTNHFWTAIGEKGGQSSASGMLINPEHPLFAAFPTDAHVNWNWWDILNHAQPMILDAFDAKNPWPKDYRSIIQPVDSWKINRKLALVAEAKVGKGKLLICSIDIESDLENRPATRQFRKSLLNYLTTSAFNPQWEIQPEAIAEVFEKETGPAKEIDFKSNALPIDN